VLLWQALQPPQGLPDSSAQLFAAHEELAGSSASEQLGALTSMASALAQLEGLLRTMSDIGSAKPSTVMRETLEQALHDSVASALAAQAAVEGVIRRVSAIPTAPPVGRVSRAGDTHLKEALQRHGRLELEALKPRLRAAHLRLESARSTQAAALRRAATDEFAHSSVGASSLAGPGAAFGSGCGGSGSRSSSLAAAAASPVCLVSALSKAAPPSGYGRPPGASF